jgi:hypothetical protein
LRSFPPSREASESVLAESKEASESVLGESKEASEPVLAENDARTSRGSASLGRAGSAFLGVWVGIVAGCSNSDDGGPIAGPDDGPPIITDFFTTAPGGRVTHGDFAQLRWRVERAGVTSIAPGFGEVRPAPSGAVSIRPHESVTYVLTASNAHGVVRDTVDVDVTYRGGIYVDGISGDDSRDGSSPSAAIRSLQEALARSASSGVLFIAAGVYPTRISIDNRQLEVYGGLDPETFFPLEQGLGFDTSLRPLSGIPIVVRDAFEPVVFSNLVIEAPAGAEVAVDLQNAGTEGRRCELVDCTINGRAAAGTALRVRGASAVFVTRCRVFASRDLLGPSVVLRSRGIHITGSSEAIITNSFIDGGRAFQVSSGIEIETSGVVGLGLNTISAEITGMGLNFNAAPIRILTGSPAIGGNILFTRGAGQRFGIAEESESADPNFLEGNLFASLGTPLYRNFGGLDANTEGELNDPTHTTALGTVAGNRFTELSPTTLFVDPVRGDYHLLSPLSNFEPNPAVDSADESVRRPEYGAPRPPTPWLDVDGKARPSRVADTDIGADEL